MCACACVCVCRLLLLLLGAERSKVVKECVCIPICLSGASAGLMCQQPGEAKRLLLQLRGILEKLESKRVSEGIAACTVSGNPLRTPKDTFDAVQSRQFQDRVKQLAALSDKTFRENLHVRKFEKRGQVLERTAEQARREALAREEEIKNQRREKLRQDQLANAAVIRCVSGAEGLQGGGGWNVCFCDGGRKGAIIMVMLAQGVGGRTCGSA